MLAKKITQIYNTYEINAHDPFICTIYKVPSQVYCIKSDQSANQYVYKALW